MASLCLIAFALVGLSGLPAESFRHKRKGHAETSAADCKVGVGFSLDFQKKKIDLKVAVGKLRGMGVRCVRLWHYDSAVIQALADGGIMDVLVNVPTGELHALAQDMRRANSVAAILKPFYNRGMTLRVAVGNEPLAPWEYPGNKDLLVPGLNNMHAALQAQGMVNVKCHVAFYNGILGTSYPPSSGAFLKNLTPTIAGVADFIHRTGSDFNIHLYPFFAALYNAEVPLNLALGSANATVGGKEYRGILHQQLAATRAALVRLNPNYATMPISVGESGWPSAQDKIATVENAAKYSRYVVANAKFMDPYLRTIYLFEAFDEQLKSHQGHGGESAGTEDNFGLMYEDGTPKFALSLR